MGAYTAHEQGPYYTLHGQMQDNCKREHRQYTASTPDCLFGKPALGTSDLALDGRAVMEALGIGPGPHVGEALRHLLDRVLQDPGLNDPAALESELRGWWLARKRPL